MTLARTWTISLDRDLRRIATQHNVDEPFFGAVVLSSADGDKEYRIGTARISDERVVDWRHPLAQLYYQEPGSYFQSEALGFSRIEGQSKRKAALDVRGRRVVASVVQTTDSVERVVAGAHGFESLAEGGRAGGPLGDLRALLTPAQHRIVSASRNEPLIVRGKAGSGKTSVALHRVAWLTYAHQGQTEPALDAAGVLVLMFNRALMSFTASMLAPLGLARATVDTFHGWALVAVNNGYGGKIKLDFDHAPDDDIAASLKKHVGMLGAIDAFVRQQTEKVDGFLREQLVPYGVEGRQWAERWAATNDQPLVRRLIRLRSEALAAKDQTRGPVSQRHAQAHKLFQAAVKRTTLYKEELNHLLTDSALLHKHLTGIPVTDLARLANNQRALAERGGSSRRPGPSIRFEDLALLLRLMQVKNGGLPGINEQVHRYEHVVIDEVQDFGAVELAVMLGAVQSRTGVTLVGDLNQKIVPGADFAGWDQVAKALGVNGHDVFSLDVAHRSTRPIMALADRLVGDTTSEGREGPLPRLVRSAPEDIAEAISEVIFDLLNELPSPHIAVVVRKQSDINPLRDVLDDWLEGIVEVRRGHNKDFTFAPGVSVTNYRQVKGLEFDAVVVVEPSEENYPNNEQGTRNLYTTITRARDRLCFVSAHAPTPRLAEALQDGLIDGPPEEEVPELNLEDLDLPLF